MLRVASSEEFTVSDESHELAWVEQAHIERYSSEWSVLRMAEKVARRTQKGAG